MGGERVDCTRMRTMVGDFSSLTELCPHASYLEESLVDAQARYDNLPIASTSKTLYCHTFPLICAVKVQHSCQLRVCDLTRVSIQTKPLLLKDSGRSVVLRSFHGMTMLPLLSSSSVLLWDSPSSFRPFPGAFSRVFSPMNRRDVT